VWTLIAANGNATFKLHPRIGPFVPILNYGCENAASISLPCTTQTPARDGVTINNGGFSRKIPQQRKYVTRPGERERDCLGRLGLAVQLWKACVFYIAEMYYIQIKLLLSSLLITFDSIFESASFPVAPSGGQEKHHTPNNAQPWLWFEVEWKRFKIILSFIKPFKSC